MKDFQLRNDTKLLFGATYRKSLTTVFPRFLKAMAKYHEEDIRTFLHDAFGYDGNVADSADRLVTVFSEIGVDMYFDGAVSEDNIAGIDIETSLNIAEMTDILKEKKIYIQSHDNMKEDGGC